MNEAAYREILCRLGVEPVRGEDANGVALPSLPRLGVEKPSPLASSVISPPTLGPVARALALPLDQLEAVLTVRVPWWPSPLYFVPDGAVAEALVAAGAATRGA